MAFNNEYIIGNQVSGNTLSSTTAYTQYLKVNTISGSSTNPERVFVYDGVSNVFSNIFVGMSSASTYAQINVRNLHPGNNASSDIVATANNGDESTNYVDMGINSSTFSGYVGGVNDAYMYTTGNNLWVGTLGINKNIYFITDNTGTTNSRLTINSAVTTSSVPFSATSISATTIVSGSTDLSNLFERKSVVKIKTTQQINSTTNTVTITELNFDILSGKKYILDTELIISGATGGGRFGLSGTTAPDINGTFFGSSTSAAAFQGQVTQINGLISTQTVASSAAIHFQKVRAYINNSGATGTISFVFRAITGGNNICVLPGSFGQIMEI